MASEQQIDAAEKAILGVYEAHFIGTLTAGNNPVSVYRVAQGDEFPVFGPDSLPACEDWLRREAAKAALEAAGLNA